MFAGAFLFRWLTVEFTNDHFVHLSRARQILLDDVAIRHFFDARDAFCQYYLSSAAQLVFGDNLFGEAILTISLVAFGTMPVFHLSAQLTGSRWLAVGATLLTVLAFPRLYNYPKVFLYVSAIGLVWLYTTPGQSAAREPDGRPDRGGVSAAPRPRRLHRGHDGLFPGWVCASGGGAQLWRRLALYAGVTAGLVLPYLVLRPDDDRAGVVCPAGSGQQALAARGGAP